MAAAANGVQTVTVQRFNVASLGEQHSFYDNGTVRVDDRPDVVPVPARTSEYNGNAGADIKEVLADVGRVFKAVGLEKAKEDGVDGLLDSGASHAMRPDARILKQNDQGTILVEDQGAIKMKVKHNCPEVAACDASDMIRELEMLEVLKKEEVREWRLPEDVVQSLLSGGVRPGTCPLAGKILLEVDIKASKLWHVHLTSGVYRLLELQSLRRELFEVRGLLNRLESRIQALEEEAAFELVDPLPGPAAGPSSPSPGSGGGSLSRGPPLSPQPGSGGVNLSQAPSPSRLPGSGGGNLSRAFSPPDRPGVDFVLAYDLVSEVFPDRSSRSNPGPPNSSFRTAVAKEVGQFLRRALDGGHLRTSGRSALTLSSKYYIVLADFEGRRFSEPCVFSAFAPAKALCIRGPDKGQSIFVGLRRIEAEAGPTLSCSIVVIAQFEGSFLVAVPQTAWRRTAGQRYLPRTALSRTVLAEVLAAASAMRHGVKLKVWLGMLDPALEGLVDFAVEGELSPDVGFGSRASERLNPYGPSLSAIASEHYAFQTPAEDVQMEGGGAPRDGEEFWEQRLTSLEAGVQRIQASLEALVDGVPLSAPAEHLPGAGVGPLPSPPAPKAAAPEREKKNDLEDILERAEGCHAASDRRHLQAYAGPIRQAWTLASIIDLLNSGNSEQAKAVALLAVAALDLAAIDNGSWLLASEFSMDIQPPFSSFQRPRQLDPLESRQSRVIDPRWISLYMSRIRERDAYHTAKRNLGGGEEELRCPLPETLCHQKFLPRSRRRAAAEAGHPASFLLSFIPSVFYLALSEGLLAPQVLPGGMACGPCPFPTPSFMLRDPAAEGILSRHLRLGLGEQLTSTQQRAVDSLRIGVSAWNAAGPYVGRAAAKFEALNDMLLACQTEAESVRASGIPLSEVLFSFAAPCNVLPVEPSRLNFVGTPSFDPLPFLDSRNRATYARPLDFARDILEDESIPRVAVRADRRQTSELLQLLDDSGRLRLFAESEIRPRLRNGLFSVAKDSSRDRMVLDARTPIKLRRPKPVGYDPWGPLNNSNFQFFYLPDESNFEIHTEDLKEFYHSFIVGEQRAKRNALALELTFEDVSHLRACSKSLRGCRIIPSLNTMAMGDLNAVALGQTAHLSVLLRSGVLRLSDFITLQGRPGRPGSQIAGLLIDDFILLDPVPRQLPSPCFEPAGVRTMRAVTESYRSSGLPRNESKAVSRAAIAEFWGGRLDGRSGLLRPGPKRTSALAQFILQLVRGGVNLVGMLEVVAGGLISALQLRRRLLSVLDSVYSVQRHRDRRAFVPVVGELCSELLVSAVLLCQVDVDLRAPAAPVLLTTDASSTAEASAAVQVPERFSLEMTRHGLQRGLWARLLSPAQAYLRERGELSESQELPEAVYVSHPLWEEVCSSLQFQQLGRTVKVKARRHINIGEVRAPLRKERVGQDFPGRRYVHLQDSQVSLGSFVKGRAASSALNRELRRSVPGHLANRVPDQAPYGLLRWREHQLRPSQLAGLPPENELWADAPIGEVPGPANARMRAVLGPEQRAASILQRAQIGAGEALEIFRRLPKELSARSTKWSRTEASFSAGVFVHGGIVGLRRTSGLFPNCIQVFTRLIREAQPGFVFSSLSVNQNVRSGGIWVLAESGSERLRHRGKDHYGEVLPVSERAVSFDPRRLHAMQPWSRPPSSRGFELSPELRRSLLEMPPGRFVISSAFGDLSSALSSAPGWLDLFSGSRGFAKAAKALAAAAPGWVLCVDVSHGLDEDLLRTDLQKELLRLIRGRAFHGVSAGPVCSSFSGAITPCWRTKEFPQGRPDLRSDQQDKVLAGNMMLEFTLEVLQAAEDAGTLFRVENPQNSWFWRQRAWDILKETVRWDDFLCDMCVFGTLWRIIDIRSYGEETALPESAGCWLAWGFQASRHLSVCQVQQCQNRRSLPSRAPESSPKAWASNEAGDDVWKTLLLHPDLLVEALLNYGQVLYDRGASLQEFRQLLAHCPQVDTYARADSLGYDRTECVLGLAPMGRRARVQHVAIDLEEHFAVFVKRVLGALPPRELLFPGSAGVYRRRWDSVLAALDIPAKFKLTPGCLRGGGAVAAYRRKQPIADIQWTMRLQHQATLAYYLQEVSAESVLPKLSVDARKNIVATSAMLPYLLRGSPAH
ncbi:unnamed protein product [Symbiodinium sp. CCMP2592]|nr:unnamed protein product [Symbiodinium sp. CCMP2592]